MLLCLPPQLGCPSGAHSMSITDSAELARKTTLFAALMPPPDYADPARGEDGAWDHGVWRLYSAPPPGHVAGNRKGRHGRLHYGVPPPDPVALAQQPRKEVEGPLISVHGKPPPAPPEVYYSAAEDAAWGAAEEEGWEAYLPPKERMPEGGVGWRHYLWHRGKAEAAAPRRGAVLAPGTHLDNRSGREWSDAERAIRRQLELKASAAPSQLSPSPQSHVHRLATTELTTELTIELTTELT